MNSKIGQYLLSMINPTINFQIGNVISVPIVDTSDNKVVEDLADENIMISKLDWDAFETSWDFQKSPLLTQNAASLYQAYNSWSNETLTRFNQLKSNEEELNRIFIDIYGLRDELTPEVEDKDVTVRRADLGRDIRSFISYAVGCMFGRYSLDVEGLVYAGGDFDTKYCRITVGVSRCR